MEYTRSCISKPTPKEQCAHIHAHSRLKSNHEARSLSPWCSFLVVSHILPVSPFLAIFMVLRDRPIFDTLRVLSHALPYIRNCKRVSPESTHPCLICSPSKLRFFCCFSFFFPSLSAFFLFFHLTPCRILRALYIKYKCPCFMVNNTIYICFYGFYVPCSYTAELKY